MSSITATAPGKIILFGEHAVVQGKTAIATSLSLRTKITLVENQRDSLVLDLPDLPEFGKREFSLDSIRNLPSFKESVEKLDGLVPTECNPKFISELNQLIDIKGLHTFLFLFCYITKCTRGFDIHLSSQLPIGSGLGSSASFCVGICAVLLKAFNIYACGGCGQCCKTDNSVQASEQPCLPQLLLINQWSLQGEKIMHGTPSGIDNAVSTLGKALTFTRKDGYKPLNYIPPLGILITDTKVSRSAKVLVEGVIQRQKKYPTLIDPVSNLIEQISNDCLQSFTKYQNDNDFQSLQETMELLFDMNHHLLVGGYGVGHFAIDKVVSITKSHGLHSKLTGAGGGGCVITLLKPGFTQEQINQLKLDLKNAGFESLEATVGDIGVSITY
ncbi:mevalonate kinase [Tieghemostelium lacteum]|uniref:Mevalonate kinase n=1 Tax=Tieghemostelium lacteum TaxID=361077 RepID=A0A151ZDZ5_TIELA|nr:mevalonate kinase [Tieghemostelium lacteum]|eukprot:KYQ92178.1 mevalonate kinase [Tieghemostelium lacteum]